tara:strand:+ start:1057 stop:1920 length:864 start_codon:yes stop_codon:yes gene_type:complete
MPELPEVEVVKESLSRTITGKKIKKVSIKNRNLRIKIQKGFEKLLHAKSIKKVKRFSKYIILVLDDNTFCVIHLGMSGTIHLLRKNNLNQKTNASFYHSPYLPKKHNHVSFEFDNINIIYNDPRRFGYFKLLKNRKKLENFFNNYGPEPFSRRFDLKYLKKYFYNKKKNIKNFLLDQKFVSGLGNIYANEILFKCKINPRKKAKFLTANDCIKIIKFSRTILNLAIKKGGSSIRDFKNTVGKNGSFQDNFKVYNRENKNCLSSGCKGIIKKKFITNRSSFFCDICQK